MSIDYKQLTILHDNLLDKVTDDFIRASEEINVTKYNKILEIKKKYEALLPYEENINLLKDWWSIMNNYCYQGEHGCRVRWKNIPFEILKGKIHYDKDYSPSNWMISYDDKYLLNLSDKLKCFCKIYNIFIIIDDEISYGRWT